MEALSERSESTTLIPVIRSGDVVVRSGADGGGVERPMHGRRLSLANSGRSSGEVALVAKSGEVDGNCASWIAKWELSRWENKGGEDGYGGEGTGMIVGVEPDQDSSRKPALIPL